MNLGIPVKEAMEKMVGNLDNMPDVKMFCTAVLIQREAGGNLAEILDKLSNTIRERFKLKGQIMALTGQARLTGYVLGCAPLVLLGILSMFFYSYVKPLYETEMGKMLLIVAAVLQVIGFLVMKKIIEIRV
jgi:tight adherence protein B